MELPSWKHVVVIVTALVCATAVEIYALSIGINGYILAGYLGIVGSVVGVPVGMLWEKRR